MTTNEPSPIDDHLGAKLRSLESLNAEIRDLESQLEQMRNQRRDLEQEIVVMRASTIPRLPTEILLYIFKEVLHGDLYIFKEVFHRDNIESERWKASRRIANLMLVCRSWHDIVINSPTLWTEINIELTGAMISGGGISRQLKYVQTFMEDSKKMPVNVSIDLSHFGSGEQFVMSRIHNTIVPLYKVGFEEYYDGGDDVGGDDEEDDYYAPSLGEVLSDWCRRLFLQDCPLVGPYEKLYGHFLGSVAGENGGHMKRWNSLHLALPSDLELVGEMLKYIDFEAPLLRSLHLRGSGLPDDWESHSLRTIATLDRIILDGDFPFSLIPQSYGAQQLEILHVESLHGVDFLNHFSNLRYLHIQLILQTPDLIMTPIVLPHLQHLRASGILPNALFRSFKITRLPRLSLDYLEYGQSEGFPCPTSNLFQIVDFLSIKLVISVWGETYAGMSRILPMLPGLFKQFSTTTIIGVEDILFVRVSSVIDGCKARRELPALRSLVKISQDGEIIDGDEYATFSASSIG